MSSALTEVDSVSDGHSVMTVEFNQGGTEESGRISMSRLTNLYSLFKRTAKHVQIIHELDARRKQVIDQLEHKKIVHSHSEDMTAWLPMHPFSYPIWNLPILLHNQRDYEMSDFTNITHLTDGSNSNIFAAKLKGETVVIKKIKIEMKDDRVTRHEFDVEHGLLARIKHPNIITLYGAGYEGDRKFLVLQFLGGGSLRHLYDKVASEKKTAIFYSKKTFTFPETLWRARELACALNYLHHECCPEAHIVHRDLKPDNIAFTADGRLILFDLGLSTIIKRKSTDSDVFEMTGGTGSLRYMAPEVALRQPYNEKADVYSFAIIVWQMMSDQIPYDGASKASYLRYACKLGDRPDVFMSWPKDFKQLLVACWHQDHTQRPSFDRIISMLDSLLKKHPHKQ